MSDSPATARWRKLIAKHATTGLSATEFAIRHNVKPGTFKWWRSRLRKLDRERAPFTELVVVAPQIATAVVCVPTPEPTVVLALDDFRAHVVVDEQTDLTFLKRILVALC